MSASGMYVLLDSSPFMDGPVMDGWHGLFGV
jgi:hypothetical protein